MSAGDGIWACSKLQFNIIGVGPTRKVECGGHGGIPNTWYTDSVRRHPSKEKEIRKALDSRLHALCLNVGPFMAVPLFVV